MALFNLDKLMWFVVFCTPFSLNLEELDIGGVGMYLPTEPLMFGIMLLFFLKLFLAGSYDRRVIYHPVTIAVLFNLVWIFITSLTSEMPVVSFKFLLSRMWFVVSFYFVAMQLFKVKKNYQIYMWSYIIPLAAIIMYAVIRLATYAFDEKAGHWVMEPFFKDHTSYGAVVALYFPMLFLFIHKRYSTYVRMFAYILIVVFGLGLVFSYTRAAWVSVLMAGILFLIYKYRIKFKYLLSVGVVGVLILAMSWTSIMMKLEKNNQDSSGKLSEHVESISNVSTDASNLERVNRWVSAWRMFKERPVFGWGPGTYVFQYAPFQLSYNATIITTNAGSNGNAHSEYIGPLAEQGFIGMLSMVLLLMAVYYRGSLLYHRLPDGEHKSVVLFTLISLLTYVVHGFLNNYLDTDKASIPFWGFIALIVAIDIYHCNSPESLDSETK
ncbi:MAG: O-antigen ligase family protein [Vicingaceae bacterium]|nr:O-antigen ligase family protein [Vicingaceae bacterium]